MSILQKISQFSIRFPKTLIGIAIFAAALLTPSASTLFQTIKTDFASLLPTDSPAVQRVNEMGQRFGSIKNLIIVFETQHKEAIPQLFEDFAQQIQKIPGIKKIRYKKPGYDFFSQNKFYYLPIETLEQIREQIKDEIQKTKLGNLYIDFEDEKKDTDLSDLLNKSGRFQLGSNFASPFLTNKEENIFLFEVYPHETVGTNVKSSEDFYKKILSFISEFKPQRYASDVRLSYSGGVKGVVEEYHAIMRDLKLAGLISWVLILIFLIQYFRSLSLTLLAFIPLIIGMIWAFGLSYWIVGQLNMITAFLFSVLAGLGIENGIHLISRYFEERRDGKSMEKSCEIMLVSTGRPAFVATLTTVGTMSVLLISDFRGFSEFGGIMAIGVIFIFLSYVLLLGPLLILAERWRIITDLQASATHVLDPFFFMRRWTKMRYVAPILFISILLGAFSLWASLSHVHFDYNFSQLNRPSKQAKQVKNKTDEIYQSNVFPAMLWVDNADEARAIKNKLLQDMEKDPTPTIDSIITLEDLVPKDQPKKITILKDIRHLLADPLLNVVNLNATQEKLKKDLQDFNTTSIVLNDIPSEITSTFYGVNPNRDQQFLFVVPKKDLDLDDGLNSMAFAADTRDIPVGGTIYHAVSHNLIFADLLTLLLRDMKIVISLAVLMAFFLLWLDFRRIKTALLVILPLIIGILWMFGFMWIFKINLNLINIVVFPCLLGMSIDNATHIFYRIKDVGVENMIPVLRQTGNSVVMSVLTAISGFAGLLIAHHGGLYSTGLLAEVGLIATLFSALFFFPALLQALNKIGVRLFFIGFFCFLCFTPGVHAWDKASPSVTIEDSIYDDLDVLVAHSLIPESILGQKPYMRSEVTRLIHLAKKNFEILSKTNKPNNTTRPYFSPKTQTYLEELIAHTQSRFPNITEQKKALFTTNTLEKATLSPSFLNSSPRSYTNPGLTAIYNPLVQNQQGRHYANGFQMALETTHSASITNYFSLFLHPRLQLQFSNESGSKENSIFLQEAYGTFAFFNTQFDIGRKPMQWGQSRYGGIMFSNNARPIDGIQLTNSTPWQIKYLGQFKYTFFFGTLGPEQTFSYAQVSGGKLSFMPVPFFEFAIARSIIFGGSGSPTASAFDIFKEFWGYRGQTQFDPLNPSSNLSNSISGFEMRFVIPPLQNLNLYTEIYFDDFAPERLLNSFKQDTAITVGFYLPRLDNKGSLSLRVEGRKTNSIMFGHGTWIDGWSLNNLIMGDPLGPDAQSLHISLSKKFSPTTRLHNQFSMERIDSNIYGGGAGVRFVAVNGLEEWRFRDKISLDYQWSRFISTTFNLGYEHIKDFNFTSGASRNDFLIEALATFDTQGKFTLSH